MTFISYAQNFEDVLLRRALRGVEVGFYVDVGASHPDADSVTRAFYDRGWHGINVEPTAEDFRHLENARPRDLNLRIAAGESSGEATLFAVPGTGLSTLDPDAARSCAALGLEVREERIAVETLAGLCRRHAPPVIHFLKIDVEGAERAVLAGADLRAHRPWIVLVEATRPMSTEESHAEWEPLLLAADYHFVWFDGLNRFYVSAERLAALAPHFRTPPNIFDDFVRAGDGEWTHRIHQAEGRTAELRERLATGEVEAAALRERADGAERWARLAEGRAVSAYERLLDGIRGMGDARLAIDATHREAARLATELETERAQMSDARARLDELETRVAAIYRSSSWRLTGPMRRVMRLVRPAARPGLPAPAPVAVPMPEEAAATAPPKAAPAFARVSWEPRQSARPIRTVHQFHSGSALHDAVTNAMLLTRGLLRRMGYESEIFVEFREPLLADQLRLLADLPRHADQVLIVRHSMGHGMLAEIAALPMPKVLIYHNITPPEFLAGMAGMPEAARLGRRQLAALQPMVSAALADSEYNAIELRTLGFDPVESCCLLFDLEPMLARARWPRPLLPDAPFTVLFTGRVTASKGQRELIAAFVRFREGLGRPARLVLAGKLDDGSGYLGELHDLIRAHGLETEVILTGLVSDEELHGWFAAADLYVSLSLHEGFGVPLVEAMAQGVPVLAWPAGAIPYTLGGSVELLESRDPAGVAARMLHYARDPALRAEAARQQRESLERFSTGRQLPVLLRALALAGAAPPEDPGARSALAANLRFTIIGHTKGTYSLSEVNRSMALHLETVRPGRVRLIPWDSGPAPLGAAPLSPRAVLEALVARPAFGTGPEVVVSNHFPVHPPEPGGDLPLALFYWEESLVPAATIAALERGFRAVLTPSRIVAKVLVDSGLSLPVRVLGQAPSLDAFRRVADKRRETTRVGPFTFLHVSSCFPRKGLDVLLGAYAATFRATDQVRLLVKTFPNPHNDAAAQIAALRARDPGAPAIELLDRELDEDELPALFHDADAMVLPTRGEGFNMPAAEAMAAELPLIITGAGGHADFVDADVARLVRWRPARAGTHLATAGSFWFEPDVADLSHAMREAVAMRGTPDVTARTVRAAARIAAHTDPAALVARLEAASLDLLLAPPAAPIRVAWISSWGVRCGVAEYSRHLVSAMSATAELGELVVLADARSEASDAADGAPRVRPCWRLGDADSMAGLARAVAQEDASVVVVQHQPGLFGFGALASLLRAPELAERAVCVTLHNTRHLLDVPAEEREAAVAALGCAARVLVHTGMDLHRLQALGLVDNVVMLPQGASRPSAAPPLRHLPPEGDALVGCYGFFLPGKGIPQLIEAVRLLRGNRPGLRLRLVNADYGAAESTKEIADCRRTVEATGMADAVEWHTDFLSDTRSTALLRDCDAIVLPTQATQEASSASLRVALAAGSPVLVTPLPIFDEAGAAVARAENTSPASMAAALERLLADRDARQNLRTAGGIWLTERDWAVIARRLRGMLLGTVAAHRSTRRGK